MLHRADGALVGTVLSGRDATPAGRRIRTSGDPYDWRIRVERAVKGDLGEVTVVRSGLPNGGSCGLGLRRGERVGLFLEQHDGRWWSGICQQVEPDSLLAAAEPLPTPNGVGPPAFLAGTTGEHRVVTLDAAGRVLRYGKGKDSVRFDVCPGGSWAAEVDEVFGFVDGRPYIAAGRRRLSSLRLTGVQRLEPFELPEPDEPFGADAIVCRDATASDVYVLGRHPGYDRDLLLRVTPGRIREVLEAHIAAAVFPEGRDVAFIATGDRRTQDRLVQLDLGSLRRREIARLPGSVIGMELDAEGSRVVGAATTSDESGEDGRADVVLFTVDLDGGRLRTVEHDGGRPVWVGDNIVVRRTWESGLDIYDDRLRAVASITKWRGSVTPVGERVFGAWDGTMYHVAVERPGAVQVFADVDLTLGPLLSVPATRREDPRLTWTALGLIAFLVVLSAIILRSRLGHRRPET